jgi:hypothetical protein
VWCGFLSPLKYIALAEFEPETFESSGKHTNHYTTKASKPLLTLILSGKYTFHKIGDVSLNLSRMCALFQTTYRFGKQACEA